MARDGVGRNDPCSCGSGRKYKHCCAASEKLVSFGARKQRELRDAVYEKILDRIEADFGIDVVHAAWGEFKMGLDVLETQSAVLDTEDPEFSPTFVPWFCFQYEMDASDDPGDPETARLKTPCRHLLDEAPECLSADERGFLDAVLGARFEFWSLVERRDGKIKMENLDTAERVIVQEPLLDFEEYEGAVIYAMVAESNDRAWLEGVGIISLPADFGASIKVRSEEILAAYDHDRDRAFVEVIGEYESIYRDFYDQAIAYEKRRELEEGAEGEA